MPRWYRMLHIGVQLQSRSEIDLSHILMLHPRYVRKQELSCRTLSTPPSFLEEGPGEMSPHLFTAYAKNSETVLVEPFRLMVLRVACASLDILVCTLLLAHEFSGISAIAFS